MLKTNTAVNPPIIENIPPALTERPQWVVWRLEERDGYMTKVPYVPTLAGLHKASHGDLMTWRTFSEALVAYERPESPYDGVGFVFCSGDPFCGIDLDDCRNPETGAIEPWAQKIIDDASEGYVEVSPSGTGVHIILEGAVRGGGIRRGKIEMYSQTRFFTITGVLL